MPASAPKQKIILITKEKKQNSAEIGRLKIREENILSMKIRANDIDLIDAKRFDSFCSVFFNCKNKYCCFNKKLNNTRLKLKTSVKFGVDLFSLKVMV